MMDINQSTELQKRRLKRIVRDYQSQGYEVIEQPAQEDTLSLPTDYQPQAIAYGENETVLIEVMTTQSLIAAVDLPEVAQIIQDHPGWRLELILTNPEKTADHIQVAYLNRREIYVRMKEAQELLKGDYKEASLLLLCSVITAALVSLAHRERIPVESDDPIFILKQLVFLALISRQDYWLLRLALKLRASIASGIQCDELEENWLREMIDASMRLLQS